MVKKLQAYNFCDESSCLLRSYVQDQQGRVKLATVNSSRHDVRKGCPQGSCFGPLLWDVFQNDLSYSIENCDISMYADDHQIRASHQLIENVATLLNNKAKIVSDWYKNNFLLANKDKFQAMFLASKAKNTQEAQIVIDSEEIECTSSLTLVGVLIGAHIQQVCQKAIAKLVPSRG